MEIFSQSITSFGNISKEVGNNHSKGDFKHERGETIDSLCLLVNEQLEIIENKMDS